MSAINESDDMENIEKKLDVNIKMVGDKWDEMKIRGPRANVTFSGFKETLGSHICI